MFRAKVAASGDWANPALEKIHSSLVTMIPPGLRDRDGR